MIKKIKKIKKRKNKDLLFYKFNNSDYLIGFYKTIFTYFIIEEIIFKIAWGIIMSNRICLINNIYDAIFDNIIIFINKKTSNNLFIIINMF